MNYAYASRTGNVESIVNSLGLEAVRINDGSETMDGDFILFTYTDGYGDVPEEVVNFLLGNSQFLKGVIVSGDTGYGDAYCQAGDKIAEEYDVEVLNKVENSGTQDDLDAMKAIVDKL